MKEFLESLRNGNALKDYVLDYYIEEADSLDNNEIITSMEDLQKYGCQSGMINNLIYYKDTSEFYDKYKKNINDLLSNMMFATGLSVEELFGNKFDKEDPLILDCFNKNLMAWFGFEETANQILEEVNENFIGYKKDYVFYD